MDISKQLENARNYESVEQRKINKEETPVFHMHTPIGWMNDPNGFSRFDGGYHLFFQYHPYSTQWGPMHWGHYITRDFVKWELRPCAMAPDAKNAKIVYSEGLVCTVTLR